MGTMEVETKFLRLFKPAAIGDRIDGWRVCWVGGWDKCRVVFVVMVEAGRNERTGPVDSPAVSEIRRRRKNSIPTVR
jgi:hypothetical protein